MFTARGYVFVALNIIRGLSLLTLLLVFSSNIVVIVHDIQAVNRFVASEGASSTDNSTDTTMFDCDYIDGSTVPNQAAGVFWAVVNRLLILFECIFLILSELGWPIKFFDTYFPVLGSNFGVGALGVFQCLIGASVLSHHLDLFALVSAFFLFSVGCINILSGLIFRERSKARRAFSTSSLEGALPFSNASNPNLKPMIITNPTNAFPEGFTNVTHSTYSEKSQIAPPYGSVASHAFGRAGSEKGSLLARDLSLTRPAEAHPHPTPRVNFNGAASQGSPAFGSSPGSAV